MKASSGGIGIEYLERQPFAKIAWMSRLAEAFLAQEHLSSIFAVNAGYAGDQKKLDMLQRRIEILLLEEPRTDIEKLKKLKKKHSKKKPKKEKLPGKKRKRVKLKIKGE
jgi:hypothetical protein